MSPTKADPLTSALIDRWEQAAKKLADLAEEIPGDQLDWSPVAGVRTPGEVLRHVAFWNQYVAGRLRGQEVDDSTNELPRADYPTKTKVLDALRRSAEDAAAALREHRGSADTKVVELVMSFNEHTSEHYGQLVVYARHAGIVPPASR